MTDTGEETATDAPPPSPPPDDRPTQLLRSRDDRIIAGVAGGFGRYTRVDPVVFRIGFVVTCFFGFLGALLYAAAWVLVPEEPEEGPPPPPRWRAPLWYRDLLFWVGIVLIAVAAVIVVAELGLFDAGWAWPLLLIGIGIALWRAGQDNPEAFRPSPATFATGSVEDARGVGVSGEREDAAPATALPASDAATISIEPPSSRRRERGAPREPRPRRPPSYLGRLTLGSVLFVCGVAALADTLGIVDVTVGGVLAVALTLIGVGLLVGSLWGRSRGLILLGLLVLPMMVAASLIGAVPSRGGAGDRAVYPEKVSELEAMADTLDLEAGQLRVDLTRLHPARTVDLHARVGMGQLIVVVPADVTVEATARARGGEINLLDRPTVAGLGIGSRIVDRVGEAEGFRLDLEVGLGQIDLLRVQRG